ncbi:MAG: putative transcriptional regulator [Anaerocolumna sp.]|jgi:ArsR family transcriptional regulator|nr:putative transcriptional regulator [Anaerocolumna sp.]
MNEIYEKNAAIFKELSDPNRLMIINLLKSGEKCACNLLEEMNISQSTLSHHMKLLCEVGVINCRREGKWMYYSLSKKGFTKVNHILEEIQDTALLIDMDVSCDCDL